MTAPRYAAVVLPVPVTRSYIYEVPDSLAERVVPGARVVVPLQRRSVVGIVTELDVEHPPQGVTIKALSAAPDAEPAISPALLDLARWMSDYYGAPLGLALRAILPGPLWSVARPAGPAPAAERLLVLTGNGLESLIERGPTATNRSPRCSARHASARSPSESPECSTATWFPNTPRTRATVWGVSAISGTSRIAPWPDATTLRRTARYTRVFPDPVTPWTSAAWWSSLARIPSTTRR